MQQLKSLAQLISPYATLYAVGGFVRDRLLGIESCDLDICSKLRVDDIKRILLNTDFAISDKNLRMGTVIISADNFNAEYTAFRTESYNLSSGAHTPASVSFTDEIGLDALRRDFSCNAVYLDILRDSYVDPTGGIEAIKNKVLVTADTPQKVFEADGLRILRLVRFAAELGFEIETETYRVAKDNAWRVRDVAAERIRDELCKIFTADSRHCELNLNDAHLKGFRLLDDLGLVDMLLPELAALKGLPQKRKYHLYDAYEHSVKAFEIAPSNLRWVALLHDVGKRAAYEANAGENMHGHDSIGAKLVDGLLARLKFSNAERERAVALVRNHMVDIKGDMSHAKLRLFAVEHADIAEDLCLLKDVDAEASSGNKPEINRLREVYNEVLTDGTPLSLAELSVNGDDLKGLGICGRDIGCILNELFYDTVLNPNLNSREKALAYVQKKREKL